jgi:hypothetical protein
VTDLEALHALSPRHLWLRYHSGLDAELRSFHGSRQARVSVDIHSINEARGLAYVTFQASYHGRSVPGESAISVLRARLINGEWRLVAFPKITAKLRAQPDELKRKKRGNG